MNKPYFTSDEATVYSGDCIEVMRALSDASVDSVVTDPPYGLEFMGKEWDGADGFRRSLNTADAGRESVFGRTSRTSPDYRAGHLFQEWCEQWAAECLRVLKPGGHLLAFGGTRTFHRLAAGIEDAGFEIRDSIAWLYGSGFPKSLDVAKAIDKSRQDDDEIEQVRAFLNAARVARGLPIKAINEHFGFALNGGGLASHWTTNRTTRGVPSWAQWLDLKVWLGFSDEMDDTVQQLEATRRGGTDAWNARPQAEYATRPGMAQSWRNGEGWTGTTARGGDAIRHDAKQWRGWGTALKPAFEPVIVARKPLAGTVAANVLTHGTGALNIDASRVPAVDAAAYAAKGASVVGLDSNRDGAAYGEWEGSRSDSTSELGRWPANVILDEAQAFPEARFLYTAKAGAGERPNVAGVAHPTVKPLDLMQWLVRLVTSRGGIVLEPFAGSGTTVEACVREGFCCIAIEREETYLPLIVQRLDKPHAVGFDFGDWDGVA